MVIPDVNILLYAYNKSSKFHIEARKWLEEALTSEEVFFSWHTITGFLRISTLPKIHSTPIPLEVAIRIVNEWLSLENTHLVSLEKKDWKRFADLLLESQATGNLVMDAYIAATAISRGAAVASTDRDFMRFSGVRLVDPISS